jgi:hypothetical protein
MPLLQSRIQSSKVRELPRKCRWRPTDRPREINDQRITNVDSAERDLAVEVESDNQLFTSPVSTRHAMALRTGDRKRLTWETRREDIVRRYVGGCHLANVAGGGVPEISRVCLLRIFVPIRGEQAPAACLFETQSHASDPAKEIDERVLRHCASTTRTAKSVSTIVRGRKHFEFHLYHSAPHMGACAIFGNT